MFTQRKTENMATNRFKKHFSIKRTTVNITCVIFKNTLKLILLILCSPSNQTFPYFLECILTMLQTMHPRVRKPISLFTQLIWIRNDFQSNGNQFPNFGSQHVSLSFRTQQNMPLEKDAHEKDAVPLPIPEKHTLHRSLPRNRVDVDLSKYGIIDTPYRFVYRNIEPAFLYELAFRTGEENIELIHTGAINAKSGVKTGRCPQDKRIVEEESSKDDVWWGKINIKLAESSFQVNKQTAVDYFNTRNTLYVVDGFAGWDEKYRIKVRMIGCQTYHALFMWNMLIRPTPEQLESFGEPDYVIYSGMLVVVAIGCYLLLLVVVTCSCYLLL